MSARYIKSLDGVRALALLLIMIYHANLLHFTWVSVQLFFVLSGYLITGILWEEKFRPEQVGAKYKKFLVRRSLRIFPLYFGYLLLLGLSWLLFSFPSYYTTYIPYLATYTFNYSRLLTEWEGNPLFTHLWTLSIEEQFYLFFPLIIFFAPVKMIRFLVPLFILLAPICRYLLGEWYTASGHPEAVVADAVYWHTLSHLDAFAFGAIMPVFNLEKRIGKPWLLFAGGLAAAFLAGIISYATSTSGYPYYNDFGYHHFLTGNYQHVWHYSMINFCAAALILLLVSPHANKKRLNAFFEHPWMVRIGKVSYGMYVFHWLVLVYLFERYIMPENIWLKALLFIPYAATVYVLAELSFRFYESHFIRMKDRWGRQREAGEKKEKAAELASP